MWCCEKSLAGPGALDSGTFVHLTWFQAKPSIRHGGHVEPEPGPAVGRVLLCSALLAAIFLFSVAGLRPPSPKAFDAPPSQFSAARALTVLNALMPDGLPHPVGSAASAAVRDRILAEFKRIGYQPELQTAFECNPNGTCATVNNILARLDAAG